MYFDLTIMCPPFDNYVALMVKFVTLKFLTN